LAAARARNPVPVQVDGDAPGRLAGGELGEDPAHDRCFGVIDAPAAVNRLAAGVVLTDYIVAEAQATARSPLAYPPFESASGLVGEVLQEDRVHRTFEADMQLADFAFGQCDQPHTGEAQSLKQPSYVLLVTRQSVTCFGNNNLKLPSTGIFKESLVGRAQSAGATKCAVGIGVPVHPAFTPDELPTHPNLVFDRGLALQVRTISSVDDRDHGRPLLHCAPI
jgi:hypothetical protein